jgi:DNA-binding NarL/FixJ family response regulator
VEDDEAVRPQRTIRVLLVGGDRLFRHGLKSALSQDGRVDVVGDLESPEAALEHAELVKPDVIVLDARHPAATGPDFARRLVEAASARAAAAPGDPAAGRALAALSPRELEVLRLLADGRENADIARELVISAQTVKRHVSNILRKLGLENRVQAATYAVRARLV